MAITYTLREVGLPASPGQEGCVVARLIQDGTATTVAITLPSSHHIKTIKSAVGCTVASNGIGAAGVVATTGFTATIAAGSSGGAVDVLICGAGT